jgi:hypothetical protein
VPDLGPGVISVRRVKLELYTPGRKLSLHPDLQRRAPRLGLLEQP